MPLKHMGPHPHLSDLVTKLPRASVRARLRSWCCAFLLQSVAQGSPLKQGPVAKFQQSDSSHFPMRELRFSIRSSGGCTSVHTLPVTGYLWSVMELLLSAELFNAGLQHILAHVEMVCLTLLIEVPRGVPLPHKCWSLNDVCGSGNR